MVLTRLSPQSILNQVWAGKPLIILDTEKEHEGDLFCAPGKVTAEVLQFMVRRASGLLCMSMPRDQLEKKGIPRLSDVIDLLRKLSSTPAGYDYLDSGGPYVTIRQLLNSLHGRQADTPFHFPVDVRNQLSGISILDRLETINTLLDPRSTIDDFDTPGHLFTLGAHPDGLNARQGHTEASVALASAAGLKPCGLLCEIIGDEGEMLRGDDLEEFGQENKIEIVELRQVPEIYDWSLRQK